MITSERPARSLLISPDFPRILRFLKILEFLKISQISRIFLKILWFWKISRFFQNSSFSPKFLHILTPRGIPQIPSKYTLFQQWFSLRQVAAFPFSGAITFMKDINWNFEYCLSFMQRKSCFGASIIGKESLQRRLNVIYSLLWWIIL